MTKNVFAIFEIPRKEMAYDIEKNVQRTRKFVGMNTMPLKSTKTCSLDNENQYNFSNQQNIFLKIEAFHCLHVSVPRNIIFWITDGFFYNFF